MVLLRHAQFADTHILRELKTLEQMQYGVAAFVGRRIMYKALVEKGGRVVGC